MQAQARGRTAPAHGAGPRPPAYLVFGEADSDRKVLKVLLEALRPRLFSGKVKLRRRPLVLVKNASVEVLRRRKRELAGLVRAEQVRLDVRALIVHEDCDAVEPAHEAVARRVVDTFRGVGVTVVPATPAWETEAWLMQWPDAFPAVHPSWPSPRVEGRHVGLIPNAKERLRAALAPHRAGRSRRPGAREYQESDAPEVVAAAAAQNTLRSPVARSDSYTAFLQAVDGLAAP